MTPQERAAMQQALEALESCNVGNWSMAFDEFAVVEAITALREALAEQAEPVSPYKALPEEIWSKPFSSGAISVPVQQAEPPVRTKDLTDDEIWEIWFKDITLDWDERCRAAIAADREKNK